MSELNEPMDADSPFHPTNAPGLALIVQMRLYDVLFAVLNKLDPEEADRIYEAHEAGRIITALPSYIPEDIVPEDTEGQE